MAEAILITDIQRFSVNDGPGFRTNVYVKGCKLRCQWCHNPETISALPELYWKKRLCVQCGPVSRSARETRSGRPYPPRRRSTKDRPITRSSENDVTSV